MNKAYIVMKKGYEYDDSYYNETEGGHPKVVCFSKEDAIKKVRELDIQSYQQQTITDFAEEDECLNVEWEVFEKFNESLIEKYGQIESHYSWDNTKDRLHPQATESEKIEYAKMVNVSFYEFLEVDVDLPSWRNVQLNQILGS